MGIFSNSSSDESRALFIGARKLAFGLGLALTLSLSVPPPAGAADECDIECLVNQLISLVNGFKTSVNSLATEVSSLASDVATSVEGADKVLAQFAGAVSKFPPPTLDISTDAAHTIQRGFEAGKFVLESEKAAYDRFVGSSGCSAEVCVPFRAALAEVLPQIVELHNASARAFASHLRTTTGVELNLLLLIDVDRVEELQQAILSQIPGQVFFPLYRALTVMTVVSSGELVSEFSLIEDPAIRVVVAINQEIARLTAVLDQAASLGGGEASAWEGSAVIASTWSETLLGHDQCWFLTGLVSPSTSSPVYWVGSVLHVGGELLNALGEYLSKRGLDMVDRVAIGADVAASGRVVIERRGKRLAGHNLLAVAQPVKTLGESLKFLHASCQQRMTQQVLLCVQRSKGNTQVSEVVPKCREAVRMAWLDRSFTINGKMYDHLGF